MADLIRPGGKAWVYLVVSGIAFAVLATVPLFAQAFAAALRDGRIEEIFLRVPIAARLHAWTGWGLTAQLWWGFAFVVAAYAALVIASEWFFRRVLDPGDDAWTSVAWSLGTWRECIRWSGIFVLAAAALGAVVLGLSYTDAAFLLRGMATWPVVALALALPFVAWNLDSVRQAQPPSRWRARSPGIAPLAALVAVHVGGLACEKAVAALGNSGAAEFLSGWGVDLVLWIPLLVLDTVVLLGWLLRARRHDAPVLVRIALSRRVLAPRIAFDLRLALLVVAALLVLLPVTALNIFVLPQVEEMMQASGGLGASWSAWAAALRWFTKWWWLAVLVLVVPVGWFVFVAKARLLVQVGATDAPTSAATPPTHPDCGPATTSPPKA